MVKLNTEIIKKDYGINKVAIQSSYILTSVYEDEYPNTNFANTLLINNKSKTFIKNTTFNYTTRSSDETNIDILNVNQSKLNGNNITISNLSNTFIVNTDNSLSYIDNLQLSSTTLFNARNQDQTFFNFPSPVDTKSFTIQPMMISNGERTIWSEGKYGWINKTKLNSFFEFKSLIPHDLNGQNIEITLSGVESLSDISNYHNGSILIKGKKTFRTVNISGCAAKLTLSGFNFSHLNITDCNNVYLQDCSFDSAPANDTIGELRYNINPWLFKKGNLGAIDNYCLSSSNSKIYIKNNLRDLNFNCFFVGIHANNNSQIFMIPLNEQVGILLNLNLTNYHENISTRPIFMLASNGSIINCNYYKMYNNEWVNTISAKIMYPSDLLCSYKGNNETFVISPNLMYDNSGNYKRVKSLLVSLWSLINNSRVNFSLNKNVESIEQPEEISIPLFGLYQMAKPKQNSTDYPSQTKWQLANTFYHIMSGTEDSHISANGNDEYYMNVIRNGEVINGKDKDYFSYYGCPSSNMDNSYVTFFPYLGNQPHLAHYFTTEPIQFETPSYLFEVSPTISARTFVEQSVSNITTLKNTINNFWGYVGGNVLRKIYINPNNNSFYYYDNGKVTDCTLEVTRFLKCNINVSKNSYISVTSTLQNYFTTSLSQTDNKIHNIYYDDLQKQYFLISGGTKVTSLNGTPITNIITASMNGSLIVGKNTNVTNTSRFYLYRDEVEDVEVITGFTSYVDCHLVSSNWGKEFKESVNAYDATNQIFYSKNKIANIIENSNTFTRSITTKIKKKKKKKKVTTNYIFRYNAVLGKFYYMNDVEKVYDLDASIKNLLTYKYVQNIDITPLINTNNSITIGNDIITYSDGRFKINGAVLSEDWIIKVYDAINPTNTKFYYRINTIDITDVFNYSKRHITTYSLSAGRNVDVYYNDYNGFFFWINNKQQLKIAIDTFTKTFNNEENEYFCNGKIEITDVVNSERNKFLTYVDGLNRIVEYNYEEKKFYYWDNVTTEAIDVTNKIPVTLQFIYNSTNQMNISEVIKNPVNFFFATLSGLGKKEIHYEDGDPGQFYYKNEGESTKYYYIDDAQTLSVTDFILKTKITFVDVDDDGNEVVSTYFYLTTPIDITNILVNSFTAIVDGELKNVYYSDVENAYYTKISDELTLDVSDQVKANVYWKCLNDTVNLTPLYQSPNYAHTTINELLIYYDNSNNILYTPGYIELQSLTSIVDDDMLWDGQGEDISYIASNYFAFYDSTGSVQTIYATFYNAKTNMFSGKVLVEDGEGNDKIQGNWVDLTNKVYNDLSYYYEGLNIDSVINEGATLVADINGRLVNVKYEKATRQFKEGTNDVTYYITGSLEYYYGNTNITNTMMGDSSFTAEVSGKERDIYYNVFSEKFYLDKIDKTALISSTISCYYIYQDTNNNIDINKNITPAMAIVDSFEGYYTDLDNNCIYTTFSYNNGFWFGDEGQLVTDYVEPKIIKNVLYKNKVDITKLVNDGGSFEGIITLSNNVLKVTQVYWDLNVNSAYFIDKDYKVSVNLQLVSYINYYVTDPTITTPEDAIKNINSTINGDTPFTYNIENYTKTVNVYYDKTNNGFYFELGSLKVYITDIILDTFSATFTGDLNILLNSIRFENSNTPVMIGGRNTYFDFETGFYYKENGRVKYPQPYEITSKIYYYYEDENTIINLNENDIVTYWDGGDVTIPVDGENVAVNYKIKEGKDYFWYWGDDSEEIDITEDFMDKLSCKYVNNGVQDITKLFLDLTQYATLNNFIDVHYNSKDGYYIHSNKIYLNLANIDIKKNGELWFYFEDLNLTEVIDGKAFLTDIIRLVYFDDPSALYVYNDLTNGDRIDITLQITPYIYYRWYFNKTTEITDAITGDGTFEATYSNKKRTFYFDRNLYLNLDIRKINTTEFAKSFYYIDNSERKYMTNNAISKNVSLSTWYSGNLVSISSHLYRIPFSTVVVPKEKILTIYHDSYGGKSKNLGVYYTYDNKGVMDNVTTSISANIKKYYTYNNADITDVINGAYFTYTKSASEKYKMYYDQLTGRYYYLSGDAHKLLSASDVGNSYLTYWYKGKLDLTSLKSASKSAFFAPLQHLYGEKLTFKIKNNNVTIKKGSTDVTHLLSDRIKNINDRWYLEDIDIKRIPFNKKEWFYTPIDGVTRKIWYRKWTKKLGKYDYYYKVKISSNNVKKVFITLKIMSKLDFYYKLRNINKVVKGAYINTAFSDKIANSETKQIYYDRKNKIYYYENKVYLDTDYVRNNIWVDITYASTYSTKWAFLAYVENIKSGLTNHIKHVYRNQKKGYWYYKSGKSTIMIDNDEIEGDDFLFTKNGDGRNYYHNVNLADRLMEDNYIKVMIGEGTERQIVNVYKDMLKEKQGAEKIYYYVDRVKTVNELIEPRLIINYMYEGQDISRTVYPEEVLTSKLNVDQSVYKNNYFKTQRRGSESTNSDGSVKEPDKFYWRRVYYNPSAGFYTPSKDSNGKYTKWKTAAELGGKYNNYIIHQQIINKLRFFYYPEDDVETEITDIVFTGNGTFTATIDGEELPQTIHVRPSTKDYPIENPHCVNLDTGAVVTSWNKKVLHLAVYYYIKNGQLKDVTSQILPNLIIRYWSVNISDTVNDGNNYFISVVGGLKRYVYYNPIIRTWYYYKDNKFTRNLKANATLTAMMDPAPTESIDPLYYCYTANISQVQDDTKDKYRFIGTTKEDVFYDVNTKDFYYYINLLLGLKEVITPLIKPYISEEYIFTLGDVVLDITELKKNRTTLIAATINGELRLVTYLRDRDKYTYRVVLNNGTETNGVQTAIHHSVEMVVSNINDNETIDDAVKITNSQLYLNVYKFRG